MSQINRSNDVRKFQDLDPETQELVRSAVKARSRAYCPYSNFAVGAALRLMNGEIVTGSNIESASYTPTICAERTAISTAVHLGEREFKAIAVVAYQEHEFTAPCGVCRQVMIEFARTDFPVYMAKPECDQVLVSSIHKLLPNGFTMI